MIVPDPGDPPPDLVLGDGSVRLHLQFAGNMLAAQAQQAPPADFHFGDRSQVEVTALLDGVPSGGMTVQLLPRLVFLPLLRK